MATFSIPKYGKYLYPDFANTMGWLMITSAIAFIPLMALLVLYSNKGNIFKVSSELHVFPLA